MLGGAAGPPGAGAPDEGAFDATPAPAARTAAAHMSPAPAGAAGTAAPATERVDPRPQVVERDGVALLAGGRCQACRYPTATPLPRCPVCGGPGEPDEIGPGGTVFSATVLRIPVPGRTPPLALAYVDLDDGPRILTHVDAAVAVAPGSRVRLVGRTGDGDPLVALDPTAPPTVGSVS
jgi:uncharacterized OB-fold protein